MKKILLRPEQDDPNDSNFWIKEFEYDPKKLEKCLIDCVQSLISQFDFNLIKDICNNFTIFWKKDCGWVFQNI